MAPKVLIVLTSHGLIEGTELATGWYLPEFAHPYEVLTNKGVDIVVASPKGGAAPLNPGSIEMFKSDPSSASFLASKSALWENTEKLSTFLGRSGEFDAIFYPGGHGPMFDLASDPESIALIQEFVAAKKPVSAVCHGPAVFTSVTLPDGKHLLAGKELTGLSDTEEEIAKMAQYMPFSLEKKLVEVGGRYKKAPEPYGPLVIVQDGGKLITGQNPASSKGLAEELAKALGL